MSFSGKHGHVRCGPMTRTGRSSRQAEQPLNIRSDRAARHHHQPFRRCRGALSATNWLRLALLTSLLLLTSCTTLLTAPRPQGESIKLGIIAPFTGPLAASGESTWRGMLLAADEINATGGVLGRRLEITTRNVGEDSAAGKEAVTELAAEGTVAIFGGIYDSVILDYLDELHASDMLLVNTWATIPTILKNGYDPNLSFCLAAANKDIVALLAEFTVETLHALKPAIIAEDSLWGDSIIEGLDGMFAQLGAPSPIVQRFHVGEPDIVAEVSKLRDQNADALIIIARSDEAAEIVRATEALGWTVPLIGHPTTKVGNFIERVGVTAINGVYILQPKALFEYENPAQVALLEAYQERFGVGDIQSIPNWEGVARGYDGVQLLVRGIEQAQATDGTAIAQALESLETSYSGILKEYTSPFSRELRNAFEPSDYIMAQWQQGQLTRAPLPSTPNQ